MTMTDNQVPDEYVEVFRTALQRDTGPIAADTPLEGLIINSIELLEIIMAFEERYDISIEVDAMEARENVRTVGDLLALARSYGLGAAQHG